MKSGTKNNKTLSSNKRKEKEDGEEIEQAKKKRKDNVENNDSQNEGEIDFNPDDFSSSQIASTFKEYLKGVKFSSSVQVENPIDLKLYLEKALAPKSQEAHEFSFGFEKHIEENENFKQLLLPFKTESLVFSSNDTICKLLLNITSLQPIISSILLDKIPINCQDDDEYDRLEDNIPKLILSQFRWLDIIVNSSKMADKLIEIMELCPPDMKKEIISFIPEIIVDADKVNIAKKLSEMMMEDGDFTIPVLETLSNLNVDLFRDGSDIMDYVFQKIESAEIEELTVVIKFLLQSASSFTAEEVIGKLREKLDFKSLSVLDEDDQELLSQARKEKRVISSETTSSEVMALDALKSGIRYNKHVSNAFLKEIQNISSTNEHLLIDVWVLFILYSFQNTTKKAEVLLKKKIKSGEFDEILLKSSIENHSEALIQFFSHLLSLADQFLRNTDLKVINGGKLFYRLIFKQFSSNYHRQETLGSLLTHIGSTSKTEVNAALDILLMLVDQHLGETRQFSNFLQGMLDFLENLDEDQIRKVYKLLATLSYTKLNDTNDEFIKNDTLTITVTKELTNGRMRYRRMGIIGVCAILGKLGSISSSNSMFANHDTEHKLTKQEFSYITLFLMNAMKSCVKVPICFTFLYDELSSTITENKLSSQILDWLKDQLHEPFESEYIKDFKSEDSIIENYPDNFFKKMDPELLMEIRESKNSSILGMTILPFIISEDIHSYDNLWNMLSHFHLLFKIAQSQNEQTSLVGLFDAALLLFSEENLGDFKELSVKEKDIICNSLFVAINWFRELLCCFSNFMKDSTLKLRVFQRLKNIIELESHLDTCLFFHESYDVDKTNHWLQSEDISSEKPTKVKESKKKNDEQLEDGDDDEKKKKSKSYERSTTKKYVSKLLPYMRELDLSILNIISEFNPKDTKTGLGAAGSLYVLQDLLLKFSVVSKRKTVSPFATTSKISHKELDQHSTESFIKKIISLIPSLVSMLETYIEKFNEDEDDDNVEYLKPTISILFELFEKLFQEINSSQIDYKLVAEKFKLSDEEKSSVEVIFDYFKGFASKLDDNEILSKILDILLCLNSNESNNDLKSQTYEFASELLFKEYGNLKGEKLSTVLGIYVNSSKNVFREMLNVTDTMILPFHEGESENLPSCLTKTTFSTFYKTIFQLNANMISQFDLKIENEKKIKKIIEKLRDSTETFKNLIHITKTKETNDVKITSIVHGKKFFLNFLKITRFLAKQYPSHRSLINQVLENIQKSIKTLQLLCNSSKTFKNSSVTKSIPSLKRDMEKIVYQTKIICKNEKFRVKNWKKAEVDSKDMYDKLVDESDENDDIEDEEEDEVENKSDEEDIDEFDE
eukprot:gene9758-2085_t